MFESLWSDTTGKSLTVKTGLDLGPAALKTDALPQSQLVVELILHRQAPGRVATGVPVFKTLWSDTTDSADPITPGAWQGSHWSTVTVE